MQCIHDSINNSENPFSSLEFSKFTDLPIVKKYIKSKRLLKNIKYANTINETGLKTEFIRYIKRHPGTIPDTLAYKITENATDEETKKADDKKTKRYKEAIERNKYERLLMICHSIFKKYGPTKSKKIIHKSEDYVDCLYLFNGSVYRIVVGKKESVKTKGFSILDLNSSELSDSKFKNKLCKLIGSESGTGHKLSKIAEGKTKEKYECQKEGSEKKKFSSYRYKVYCSSRGSDNSEIARYFAPHILEKLGYILAYKGDKNSGDYGALGKGSFNMVYKEAANKDGIERIIRICINSYDVVNNERKGNKMGIKAFLGNTKLSEITREKFYNDENFVLNKNKHFGQIKDLFSGYELDDILKKRYGKEKYEEYTDDVYSWYCVSTGTLMSGGSADKFEDDIVNKFKEDKTEKLKELQAFTKGLLESLVKMHKQGLAHLDVKPENVMKKKKPNATSAPYFIYLLTDFGTALNVDKKIKNMGKNWDNSTLCGRTPAYSYRYDSNQLESLYKNERSNWKNDYVFKIDSFSVGASMLVFFNYFLNGNNSSLPHAKILNSESITDIVKLSEKDSELAKKLAKELTNPNLKERLSCEEALKHEFITTNL